MNVKHISLLDEPVTYLFWLYIIESTSQFYFFPHMFSYHRYLSRPKAGNVVIIMSFIFCYKIKLWFNTLYLRPKFVETWEYALWSW